MVYAVEEDFMKAVRKVGENKKLEGKLESTRRSERARAARAARVVHDGRRTGDPRACALADLHVALNSNCFFTCICNIALLK